MNLRPTRIRKRPQPAAAAPRGPARGNKNKAQLALCLRSLFGDAVVTEHRFHPVRQWRFDWAIPSLKLAIEYQGHGMTAGAKTGAHIGRHASLTGMAGDCEKLNAAQLAGWRVLLFTSLHFDPRKRAEFKLSAPLDTLKQAANPQP